VSSRGDERAGMAEDKAAHGPAWAFREIVEGLPAIVALFTAEGRIMFCNRRMLEYLDETLEQVQAKASAYNFHPADSDGVLAQWGRSGCSGQPFSLEARLRRADGVYRWHHTQVFPLRGPEGDVALWYGLSTDIEDTRRAEAEARRANRFLN